MPVPLSQEPSQAELRRLFVYEDGQLFWLEAHASQQYRCGEPAGYDATDGYKQVTINGTLFRLHRLIWVYHHGAIPKKVTIDHADRDNSNNRIENLRLATRAQQNSNRITRGFCLLKHLPIGKRRYQVGLTNTTTGRKHRPCFLTALQARLYYEQKGSEFYGEHFPPLFFTESISRFIADGGAPLNTSNSYRFLSN